MDVTHPAFRSIVGNVFCAEDINDQVGTALIYQHMFERRTSPWEMAEWQEGELDSLEISTENIDRLYHIHHHDDGVSGREFQLLARMDHGGRSVYVELMASCDSTGFDCQGGGEIYVTNDPQIFIKSIMDDAYDYDTIWRSMVDDGLQVEQPTEFDIQRHWQWKKVPMLKFLCHMAVHDEQDKLSHYGDVLPDPLSNSIREFVKERSVRDHHDYGY